MFSVLHFVRYLCPLITFSLTVFVNFGGRLYIFDVMINLSVAI